MGSLGWVQCFWCPRWMYNPPVIHMQWGACPEVLCPRCYWNHLDGVNDGVPPHPNAIDHKAKALEIILPPLHDCGGEVVHHVASFLDSPWRPGAGSLPRPRPPPGPAPPPPTAPGGPPQFPRPLLLELLARPPQLRPVRRE